MSLPRDNGFRLELLERMILIREFEEGVKFLFLEGTMPGTIHQCQGQEATAVGVCAALRGRRFHHLHLPRPRPRPGEGARRSRSCSSSSSARRPAAARARADRCTSATWTRGMVPGIAIVGGGIPLAAGMALAFKMQKSRSGRRLLLRRRRRGRGGLPRGRQPGRHLGPAGRLRLREQPLRRLDPGRPGDAHRAHRRPGRALRHPRADGRRQRRAGRLSRRPGRRVAECRGGKGPVLLELLTYRRTGHSRRDACHYQPEDGARGMAAAGIRSSRLRPGT